MSKITIRGEMNKTEWDENWD